MAHPIGPIQGVLSFVYTAYQTISTIINYVAHSLIKKIKRIVSAIFPIPQLPACGHIGGNLYAKNVRILFINGVGYSKNSSARAAKRISTIFGNCSVHYTFVPLSYAKVVQAIAYGKESIGCDLLLQNIKMHLRELKKQKPDVLISSHRDQDQDKQNNNILIGNSRLILFAHSGGGAMVEAIQKKLTRAEKQHIDIISFGSAHLFRHNCGFNRVINIVARGDPVPYISDSLYRYTRKLRELLKVPRFVGHRVTMIQRERHRFLGDVYTRALKSIKEEYDLSITSQKRYDTLFGRTVLFHP